MADAQLAEFRALDYDTGGGTTNVEIAGIVVPAAGGPVPVGGFLETGTNAVAAIAVGGGTPHDSVDSGNPVKIGGRANALAIVPVADDDRVDAWFGLYGEQVVRLVGPTGVDLTSGDALAVEIAAGSVAITGIVSVQGMSSVDSLIDQNNMFAVASRASTATPTPVSADGDAVPIWATRSGALVVDGGIASDAADAGNPLKIGGRGNSATPTAVANGDRVDAWFGLNGDQRVGIGPGFAREVSGVLDADDETVEIDASGAGTVVFDLRGDWDGLVMVEGTVDGTDWFPVQAWDYRQSGSSDQWASGIFALVVHASPLTSVRLRLTVNTAGSATIVARAQVGHSGLVDAVGRQALTDGAGSLLVVPGNTWYVNQGGGAWTVYGPTPHDAVDSFYPIKVGGHAYSGAPAAVSAAGDITDAAFTLRGALHSYLVDSSGNPLSVGGGTQYVEDVAFAGNGTGTLLIARRDDALSTLTPIEDDAVGLRTNNRGALWVAVDGSLSAVAGDTAHDAVDAGNPVKIGGYASNAVPTSVNLDGDRVNAWFLRNGALATVVTANGAQINGDTISADAIATSVIGLGTRSFSYLFNGTTWSRQRSPDGDAQADTGLAIAAGYVFNGSTWDRARSGGVTGMQGVSGDTAHDAADSGNPIKIGGKSTGGTPSGVASGDRVDAWFGTVGTLAAFIASGLTPGTDTASLVQLHNASGPATGSALPVGGYIYNGSNWERARSGGVLGMAGVSGDTAHDAVDAGNPVKIGGKAAANRPTAVLASDRVNGWFGTSGQFVSTITSGVQSAGADGASLLEIESPGGGTTQPLPFGGYLFNGATWDRQRSAGVTGMAGIGGSTAADLAIAANPVTIGGRASTAVPTAVSADGDVVDARFLRTGAQVVHVVDAAGAAQAFGGGTQYTEGDTDATITGTALLWEDAADTLVVASAAKPLPVGGNVAHDAVDSGNPLKIGGKASVVNPTSVASGDRVDAHFDQKGRLGTWLTGYGSNASAAIDTGANDGVASSEVGLIVNGRSAVYNGTTWDRQRSVESVSTAPNVDTGILAVGIGPGFDRKRNPANLGTAVNSASAINVDGADVITVSIGTTTSGTFVLELSADDTNWWSVSAYSEYHGGWVGGSIAPDAADILHVLVGGWRQFRLRTDATLGATMAHKFTAHAGSSLIPTIVSGVVADSDNYISTGSVDTLSLGMIYDGGNWDRIRSGGVTGMQGVSGDTAHDAIDAGNPQKIGGYAKQLPPTAVADGDRVNAWFHRLGSLKVHLVDDVGSPVDDGAGKLYAQVSGTSSRDAPLIGDLLPIAARASTATPSPVSADGDGVDLWATRSGALVVDGGIAHDAVDAGNPVKIGGKASSSVNPTSVAGGDRVDAHFDVKGRLGSFLTAAGGTIGADVLAPSDGQAPKNALLTITQATLYNGSTWDQMRTVQALSAAPNVDTGILAVGAGPGFDRKTDPAGVAATSTSNAVEVLVNGAGAVIFHVTTIGTTPGSMIFQTSGDDTAWATAGAVLKLNTGLWVEGAFVPAVDDVYMVRTAGLRRVRYKVNAAYASGTATVKVTATASEPIAKAADIGSPPHSFGYSPTGISAQYTSAQTSTTIGPTVASTERMVVTYLQIQAGGTVAATQCSVYFGTGAFSRGTSKAVFDGEFAPSATSKPGFAQSPSVPWIGAADEELKITSVGATNPLTVTIWYYLVAA